jgi:hypothetical protein
MASGYAIELTREAKEVYERMYEEADACVAAGDETNSKVTQFRIYRVFKNEEDRRAIYF